MNSVRIVDIVHQIDVASDHMVSWMRPGGVCCLGPRAHGYCTAPGCVERREAYAAQWARVAGHYANKLMALAKGRVA